MVGGCAVVLMSAVPGLAAQTPQEHQHAADQRLDDLVAKMNTATGMEKMAATATVVTEMVTQCRTMRDGMMKMQEGMMSHLIEHMQAGTGSMAMCPMMKQTGGMKRE